MTPAKMTFMDHIKELRRRFLWVFLAASLSGGVAYIARNRLIEILQHPLARPLYFTSPAGSFNFILKLSVIVGLFIALPVLVYQILRFIEPALPTRIGRSLMAKIVGASFLLAVAGVGFGFFIMIPMSLHFFLGYSTAQIKPLITADEYFSFVLNHMLTFAVAFQIPMIFLFINRIKPLSPRKLLRYQRHVVVGAFALAIILPFTYDPLSQFIVAIPIVVLYYFSILLIWLTNRSKPKSASLAQPGQTQEQASGAFYLDAPKPLVRPAVQPRPLDGFVRNQTLINPSLRPKQSPVQTTAPNTARLNPRWTGLPKAKVYVDGVTPLRGHQPN